MQFQKVTALSNAATEAQWGLFYKKFDYSTFLKLTKSQNVFLNSGRLQKQQNCYRLIYFLSIKKNKKNVLIYVICIQLLMILLPETQSQNILEEVLKKENS